mmetsp:Transcript_44268/g.106643  ORF Transcript_44268/g.106643 Transcript_44268/m.106643 type:complete len:97 (-) Transcript_44268:134-424(-)
MRQSLARESSWATLDTAPATTSSENAISKRGSHAMKTLPTVDEDTSDSSMRGLRKIDEGTAFQSITPNPSGTVSKTARREQMTKMSSWACLGIDDL